MKYITFDGIDKCGKSTLIDRMWKETNGLVMVMDRSISSWHFFNELLERVDKTNKKYYKEYKEKLNSYRQILDLAVILEVNEDDWNKRCKQHNEPELKGGLSFKDHQNALIKEFDKAKYPNVLRLNTSVLSEDECVSKILKRLGIYK